MNPGLPDGPVPALTRALAASREAETLPGIRRMRAMAEIARSTPNRATELAATMQTIDPFRPANVQRVHVQIDIATRSPRRRPS